MAPRLLHTPYELELPLDEEGDELEVPCCRECGCTEFDPCPGGCFWVETDLCSVCVRLEERP